MGEVKVSIQLENYSDLVLAQGKHLAESAVRRQQVKVLVATGAVMLMLPRDLVEALGLATLGRVIVTYADERREERDTAGVVRVTVDGRAMETRCVVGPPGSEPLLGQVVLEETDLLVDPTNQCLIPRPDSPFLPTLKMKSAFGVKSLNVSQAIRVC